PPPAANRSSPHRPGGNVCFQFASLASAWRGPGSEQTAARTTLTTVRVPLRSRPRPIRTIMPAEPTTPIVPDPLDLPPRQPRRRAWLLALTLTVIAAIAVGWYWYARTPDASAAAGPAGADG